MYIYTNHLDGGLYASETELDFEDLYCETCGDSDRLIGEAESCAEAWELLKDDIDIDGSGGWAPNYVLRFLSQTWPETKLDKIVCFELNNWGAGADYPAEEPFLSWMRNDFKIKFRDKEWIKENRLCVRWTFVDMSQNFCITAPREWVEKNCPTLLTKFVKFLRFPDEYGEVQGRFGTWFAEYQPENTGCKYVPEEE